MPKIELKNLKTWCVDEPGYSATVYIDGRRAGTTTNAGRGGESEYHFKQPADERAFEQAAEAWAAAHPEEFVMDDGPPLQGRDVVLGLYVEYLMNRQAWARKAAKLLKQGRTIVAVMAGTEPGTDELWAFFDATGLEAWRKQHPDRKVLAVFPEPGA